MLLRETKDKDLFVGEIAPCFQDIEPMAYRDDFSFFFKDDFISLKSLLKHAMMGNKRFSP